MPGFTFGWENSAFLLLEESMRCLVNHTCPTCGQPTFFEITQTKHRNGTRSTPRKLPFPAATLDLRDRILAAIWAQLEPALGRAVRSSDWRAQNRRAALAMARADIAPAAVVKAWQMASERRGEPIVLLTLVHREIEMAHSERYGVAHA